MERKNAFTIFETLNDRGRSLTVMDLVKNLLFAEIGAGDENSAERAWADVLESLDELTLEALTPDFFLFYAWNSRQEDGIVNADTVEQARLRRSIADHVGAGVGREARARNLILGLQLDAKILLALNQTLASNGAADSWRTLDTKWRRDKFEPICDAIYGTMVAGSNQPLPLLLSLMRSYLRDSGSISRSMLLDFLAAIEHFQFRWSIAQKASTSTIRRVYRQAASAVSVASHSTHYASALATFRVGASKIDASDVQFRDGISRLTYSRTRGKDTFKIRHILTRIEKSRATTRLDLSRQMTMEHLQGLEGRSEATPRNSWIFKIGNLALVPPEVNASLPKDFADKCEVLQNWISPDDNALTNAIHNGTWRAEQSSDRISEIVQRSLELWPRASA